MHLRWATNQYAAGFVGSMSVMTAATCIAWVAPMLPRLLKGGDSPVHLTSTESSWMVSLIEVGPFFTPTIAGLLADRCGRKPCMYVSVLLYFISWLLIIYVTDADLLYVARMLQGMGVGITFTIVPLYLGEIAETRVRGAVTTLFQTMFHVGLLYEYIFGPYFSYRTVAFASALMPVVFFLLFLWQPESPYYYLLRHDEISAYASLRALRNVSAPTPRLDEELQEMKAFIEADRHNTSSWKDVVSTRANRKALFLVLVVTVTKACCGVLAVLSYATEAFAATPQPLLTPDQCTIVIGVIMSVVASVSSPLVDRLGRRPLFLVSSFGSGVCNVLVGTYYYVHANKTIDVSEYGWFTLLGLALFAFFFSFGLGPINLTLQSELFPANTRGIASSICSLSFSAASFMCLKFYQVLIDNFGIYMNYWLFGVSCFVGFFIILFTLPETKGKTFAEIQQLLAGDTDQNSKENKESFHN